MATEVVWTVHSEFNLQNVFRFIANDSAYYADLFVRNLVSSINKTLSTSPFLGRKVPEFEGTHLNFLREVIFRGYRIIYDPTDAPEKVFIIGVVNGRQELRNINTDWDID